MAVTLLTPFSLCGQDLLSQEEDEAAIRKIGADYVKAFNNRNAKLLASYWSPKAIYVNRLTGEQVVGRDAIRQQFENSF